MPFQFFRSKVLPQGRRDATAVPHTYNPVENIIRRYVKPGMTAFDIGANQGAMTKLMLDAGGRVTCFEPVPHLATALAEKFPQAHVEPLAVADRDGVGTFYVDVRPEVGAVASSLLPNKDLAGQTIAIQSKTVALSTYCNTHNVFPDFIKIDVEGYEPAVFLGARSIIEQRRPIMVFEFWETHLPRFADTFTWLDTMYDLTLASTGQSALDYYKTQRNGIADILCLPRPA